MWRRQTADKRTRGHGSDGLETAAVLLRLLMHVPVELVLRGRDEARMRLQWWPPKRRRTRREERSAHRRSTVSSRRRIRERRKRQIGARALIVKHWPDSGFRRSLRGSFHRGAAYRCVQHVAILAGPDLVHFCGDRRRRRRAGRGGTKKRMEVFDEIWIASQELFYLIDDSCPGDSAIAVRLNERKSQRQCKHTHGPRRAWRICR